MVRGTVMTIEKRPKGSSYIANPKEYINKSISEIEEEAQKPEIKTDLQERVLGGIEEYEKKNILSKIDNLLKQDKIYFQPDKGEQAPAGVAVMSGPRHGDYYISKPASKVEQFPVKEEELPQSPIEKVLSSEKVKISESLNGGCNVSVILTLEDGTKGVFKPVDGESSYMRDSIKTGTFYKREVAAYVLCKYLGWNYCPETVIRKEGEKIGSIQKFVEGASTKKYIKVSELAIEDIENMTLYNLLMANTDRHGKNWLFKDGKPIAIDHGMCFPENGGDLRSKFIDYYKFGEAHNNAIPDRLVKKLEELRSKNTQITKELGKYLESTAIALYEKRLNSLLSGKVFWDDKEYIKW